MSLIDLSSRELSAFTSLHKQRNKLKAKLAGVIAQIESFGSHRERTITVKTKKRTRRGKHGTLGAGILSLLKTADGKGLHIDIIAKKLNRKKGSVYAWFYGAGRKKAKKIAPATYISA